VRPTIRPGQPDDADEVAALCRATARAGEPQEADHPDPELVALVYARPYLELEPATSRVLIDGARIVGYVVGAVDSAGFYARWEQQWAPRHLPRPVRSDPTLVRLLERPTAALPVGVAAYPSHLHVNLLPEARGSGRGRLLLADFLDGLRSAGSPGVHLRLGRTNDRARRFYQRFGFDRVLDDPGPDTLTMVLRLVPAVRGRPLTPAGG
jgi:GNAT superfamily N-acetyltransferase